MLEYDVLPQKRKKPAENLSVQFVLKNVRGCSRSFGQVSTPSGGFTGMIHAAHPSRAKLTSRLNWP